MPNNLSDQMGTPIFMTYTSNAASDAWAASDCIAGVSVKGAEAVLFLIVHSVAFDGTSGGGSVQVQYSSTGSASDAATSNTTMSCTDAVISFSSTVNAAAGMYTIYLNTQAKGLSDAGGKLFVAVQNDSATTLEVMAVPVLGTGTLPGYSPTVTADAT